MDFKKKGVFSPCESMDSISMIKCLQALVDDYPSIKFHSVTTDKKYRGFRVFFTEPEDSVILEKNLLSSERQSVSIYPLTTYLMVYDLDYRKSPLFERDLRSAIDKKFGKVLGIVKTENTNRSQDWRIEIDIPEYNGLEAFKKASFTNITLFIPTRNQEVVLRFWCRQCKLCGHFQHDCLLRSEEKNTEPSMTTKENNAAELVNNSKQQACSSSDQRFQVIERMSESKTEPKNISNLFLEPTEKYAEKIGTEQVKWFGKENNECRQNNITTNAGSSININFLTEKYIKKENEELDQSTVLKENKNTECKKTEILENNSLSKKDMIAENVGILNKNSPSSTDVDDEIEFIGYMDNSSANKSSNASNYSTREESRNFQEETKAFEPERLKFSDVFPGPSRESSSLAAASPRGAEVTTILSERLQDCINQVCKTGVLERQQLDAFLIHVKKKSNPIRVALNYTSNTRGLKEQLQGILRMYYSTPQTGTKEDIQFIKWLNGLVERYDGSIPKKRKRSGKTDDEPSTKK